MANVIVSGNIISYSCGSRTLSRMHCLWEVTRQGNIVVIFSNFQESLTFTKSATQ